MLKYLIFACLMNAVTANQNSDIQARLVDIFGTPNNTNIEATTKASATTQPDLSCIMENGDIGQCVRYYQCTANDTIITDGVGLINDRFQDGSCSSYLDVCCLMALKRPAGDPVTLSPNVSPTDRSNLIDANGVHSTRGFNDFLIALMILSMFSAVLPFGSYNK